MTDLRLLTSASVKDAYLLTNISENLQKLKDATIFTSIDACGAYHCVQIEEGSRDCTAFIQNLLLHMYDIWLIQCRVHSQMLDQAMAHIPEGFWLSYLDAILVHSIDPWGHLEHLKKVVQAHTQAGIKIKPKKTKIFQSEVSEY